MLGPSGLRAEWREAVATRNVEFEFELHFSPRGRVVDDPNGHDIARYTPPTGPVTFTDKVRASLVLSSAGWIAAAALAAGPFLRRSSLDVRAG